MALFKKYLEKGVESAPAADVKKAESAARDAKKAKRQAKNAEQRKRVSKWWRELKSEFKKIVWPTRAETTKHTVVVLVVIVIVSAVVTLLDFVFEKGLLEGFLKLVTGY